jgi:hypothetical protein
LFSQKADSTTTSPRKEEVELLLQKLERDLKETCHEKDKALRELARLKQHLLEKVAILKFPFPILISYVSITLVYCSNLSLTFAYFSSFILQF